MRTFYRAVESSQPTRGDFLSDAAKGQRMRPLQRDDPRLYHGISVFDSLAELNIRRQRVRQIPPFTAELAIPDGAPVQIHKTLGTGHWTLIGDADTLLGFVARVV